MRPSGTQDVWAMRGIPNPDKGSTEGKLQNVMGGLVQITSVNAPMLLGIPYMTQDTTLRQETTPGDKKDKTKIKKFHHRGAFDTTSLGRYAFQTTQKTTPPGVPHKSSTDIFRQRTSWRTTTISNRGRALPHGRPINVGRTRLWPRTSQPPRHGLLARL